MAIPPMPGSSGTAQSNEESRVTEEIPQQEKRTRTPKFQKLQKAIEGIYIMAGGGLATVPITMGGARTKVIGINIARSSEEIAEAWVDLAEDDKRVLRILENLTSFSGWGKVIGLHLMVVGAGIPGIAAVGNRPQQQQTQQQSGPGDSDLVQAMQIADFLRQMQSEARANQPQESQMQQQPQPQAQPQQPQDPRGQVRRVAGGQVRAGRGAGIPSPADLGVTNADVPLDFPSSGSESVN